MNVLVIDDHPVVLKDMRVLAQQLGAENDVVIAPRAHAVREAFANSIEFDLVLLAIPLDIEAGFALLEELRSAHPELPIVVVAASSRDQLVRAVELGAMGFVPQGPKHSNLLSCLVLVLSAQRVRDRVKRRGECGASLAGGEPARETAGEEDDPAAAVASLDLTPRRKEVLTLMLRGQSNKLIARELNLSIDTIKDHVTGVLRSLKVESRTQAAAAVSELSKLGAIRLSQPPHRSVHRAA